MLLPLALQWILPGAGRASSPPIPLVVRDGSLCVSLTLAGGSARWFVLDTGSARSYLTPRAYARLAADGARVSDDGTLTVRGASLSGFAAPPIPFARESDGFLFSVESAADGTLGRDFLARYRVGLDLAEGTMRLWPPGATSDEAVRAWLPPAAWVAPIETRPEGPCVTMDLGNLSVPMLIDTGCAETFLHSEVAEQLRDAPRKRGSARFAFYNGIHRVRFYAVRSTSVGGLSLGERTINAAAVPRMVGLLGRDVLLSLRTLIDYPAGRMHVALKRPAPPRTAPLAYDGPRVAMPNGVVVRWPRDVVVHVPAWATYTLPDGYREVSHDDESVDLIPPKDHAFALRL